MNIPAELEARRGRVDAYLSTLFSQNVPWKGLYEAMAYSVYAGGKRVRPILTLAFCSASGGDEKDALPLGCAVELMHTYSLIHDDLPCMDNDDLRRGKPTSHVRYGEGAALLAGDALQTAAFELILSADLPAEVRTAAALELARRSGADGMCGGQQLDLEGEGQPLSVDDLRMIHRMKTGALLECACVLGVLAAQGTGRQISAARAYAEEVGLAFQIRDDLLDHISSAQEMGKTAGSDAKNRKTTFYTLLGRDGCESEILSHTSRAKAALSDTFSDGDFLCAMADWLANRMN